ncbi:uncharacterized protein [Solanum tuberosum]|uniref:uncharacterized protein n=1 Tax=Solanum tuberosum TaxID=4113 RepID=UPI00073A160E|nr:PREDICTED: uncharacterized protein LOC107059370 [Solanum tuberosum]XP_015167392.1 PREDICTED: uncharacterized protein LOC107061911 [Solanum tuberosum]
MTNDTTNIATNTTDAPIDSSSPLYIHPSDNPGAMLVPNTFDGTGYRSWRRGVLRSLSVKNKLGFINGKCEKPTTELWRELKDRYDQTNGAKLYQIQKEINDLSQGILDITVRGNILMMNPLPSLPQTFSLLVQDERQREIRPGNQLGTASTSLSASVSRSGGYNANNGTVSRPSYDASGVEVVLEPIILQIL